MPPLFGPIAGALAKGQRSADEIRRQREQEEIQKLALMAALSEKGVTAQPETMKVDLPDVGTIGGPMPRRAATPQDTGIVDPTRYQPVGRMGGQDYYRDRARELAAARAAERQQRIDEALKQSMTDENRARAFSLMNPAPPAPRNIDPNSSEGIKAYKEKAQFVAGLRPSSSQKPPTEGERRASALLMSGEQGYNTLRKLIASGKRVPSWTDTQMSRVGMGGGNLMTSDEYKQLRQAGLQLADAWLRYTSGANVPEQEVERFAQTFIPQPGDDDGTLLQKAKARETIIRALRAGAGRAAPNDQAQAEERPAIPFPDI